MQASIEKRLQHVEDILAIQQLFNDYASHLDAGEFDRYAALFSRDGEVKLGPMGRAKGREAIESLMCKHLKASVGQSFHIISNPVISLSGDVATAKVMWTVIVRSDTEQPVVAMIGHHRDELIREAGQWRFKVRAGFVDIPKALSDSQY